MCSERIGAPASGASKTEMFVRLASLLASVFWLAAAGAAPPPGFQLVTAAPSYLLRPEQFAPKMMMTVDDHGDPAFAYLILDASNDRDTSSAEVDVVSWNRATDQWNPPVRVDIVGEVNINGTRRGFSLAVDPGSHRFGIAYMVGLRELRIAWSDDRGSTWTRQTVQRDPQRTFEEPSLALANGRAFLAYHDSIGGRQYRAGAQSDPPERWSSEPAPQLPDTKNERAEGVSTALSLASNGRAAATYGADDKLYVAYVSPNATPEGAGIVLWREP